MKKEREPGREDVGLDALRESEARFRSLTELSSDFYWETDARHRVIEAIHGSRYDPIVPPGNQAGKARWELPSISPDAAGWAAHRAVMDSHAPFRGFEFTRLDTAGSVRTLSISGEPIFDDGGAFKGYRGVGQDITVSRRTEAELRSAVSLLSATLESTADGILVVAEDHSISLFNQRFTEMWRIPREIIDSRDDSRALGFVIDQVKDAGAFAARVEELYARPGDESFDIIEFKDGRTFERFSRPQLIAGKPAGRVWSFRDITNYKRAEQELRTNRRLLEIIIDAIPMAIFAKDTKSNYVMANKYTADFFATTKEELTTRHTSQLPTHEATRTQSLQDDQWVYRNRRTLAHETFIQRPDGTPVPFNSSKIPLFDDAGELIGLLGINRDISYERRAQDALRESEQRFRAVFERSKAGIAIWGLDGLFLTVNNAFCEFVGHPAEELIGRMSAGDLRQAGDDEGLDLTGKMRRGEIAHMTRDRRYRRRDASTVWGRTTIAAVTDKGGAPQYFVAVVIDITEAREAHERIERFNIELEERVEARTAELRGVIKELDAFTYSVSHDLRAPVGAVSGFAHLLRASEGLRLTDDGRHLLGVIENNAERMVELIEGLLRFSRLGRATVRRQLISMDALAREVLRELTDAAHAEVRVDELPPCQGDPVLIRQVWVNLVGNALKYSKTRFPARIVIGWDAAKQAYFVRDNGVGFDMQYVGKLFGAFERLHGDGEFEGSGIGLAIVQRIIERHGGQAWADAAVERGATFWFTVPAAPA
jgi:PAS domain S-box-containing protein